ncbi:hypothetical protein GYA19_04705 [Candidatus Beckwithbacteria bacterium]|nr:hypothetical protein [Candidatus Beckwithbacteria bacterium]
MNPAFSDFQGKIEALNLTNTLQNIDNRHTGRVTNSNSGPRTAGDIFSLKDQSKLKIPIFNNIGEVFNSNLISDAKKAYMAPANLKLGSLIQFDNRDGSQNFGMLIEPEEIFPKVGIYVKEIDKEEFIHFKTKTPEAEIIKLGQKNVEKIEKKPLFKKDHVFWILTGFAVAWALMVFYYLSS